MIGQGSHQLTMDIVSGKCHVFSDQYGRMKSIFSSEKAFEALNYIITQDSKFQISDMASLWIDMEAYEDVAKEIKDNPKLYGLCT